MRRYVRSCGSPYWLLSSKIVHLAEQISLQDLEGGFESHTICSDGRRILDHPWGADFDATLEPGLSWTRSSVKRGENIYTARFQDQLIVTRH
jgi:hypothetical protein